MKRKIAFLLLVLILSTITNGLAYNFPEPNWTALLNERKAMVEVNEFELYIESHSGTAPYYGAKLEPYYGAYLGMTVDTSDGFLPLSSYLSYIDGLSRSDLYYPANSMVKTDEVITTVAINVNSINNIDYDALRRILNTLNSYNKPMAVRFANEMNCSPLGDEPDHYISAFRNFANIAHEYDNLATVWSPNDMGALDRPFQYYYPGDEYVDWVGLSCYTKKYFMDNPNTTYNDSVFFMTGDFAWATNKVKPLLDFMKKYNVNKPIMISEGGTATSNRNGEAYEEWALPRLRNMLYYLVMKYPQIKLINYFNVLRNDEYERYNISNHNYATEIFKEASRSGAYIQKFGEKAEFSYVPANSQETVVGKNGIVNLYTFAYLTGHPTMTVNYSIDGIWYSLSSQIPYKCALNLNDISDGQHTLTIAAYGTSKNYSFIKRGNSICFGKEPDPAYYAPIIEEPITLPEPISEKPIQVILNGKNTDFSQPPIIVNGSTLVPMREIFESFGATVNWQENTQTVISLRGNIKISMQIGSNKIYINDAPTTLGVEAQLINSKTMVPLRAVSEAFGCTVTWVEEERTVIINE